MALAFPVFMAEVIPRHHIIIPSALHLDFFAKPGRFGVVEV